jgi:hypothetical protein
MARIHYNIEQQMLTLCYIAYCGYDLWGSDKHNARKIAPQIVENLALEPATADKWRLVWGPTVNQLLFSIFDDNMAYIVQNYEKPNCFAVVFRGTNPVSLSNWIVEDFSVLRHSHWKIGKKSAPKGAKISHGTQVAMDRIKSLEAPEGVPGAGTTMLQFLRIQAETHREPLEIYVTGHSLGGTLAATYGLWLQQTSGKDDIPVKQQWDPNGKANISVVAYAGATAGNQTFADYSDTLLTVDNFKRLANSLDIVPHAWNIDSINQLHDIYKPDISANLLVDLMIAKAKISDWFCDYAQPQAQQKYLEGTIDKACDEYFLQAIYQHVVAYPDLMGLKGILDPLKYFPILKDVLPCYAKQPEEVITNSHPHLSVVPVDE